jgi:hypothetical protein
VSHFAQIDENNIVVQVIVAEQDFIDSGSVGDPSKWIQTSYNTHGGQHPEGRPLRKNYAGIGWTYDKQRDAFISPKPHSSWILDEETCWWVAPTPYPNDGNVYVWNEESISWDLIENNMES